MNDDIVKPATQPEQSDATETSELEKVKKQADDYLNGWKRAQADFINYKKDEAKRLEEFVRFAASGLILEVIEVVDDLETASKSMTDKSGVEQIIKKFTDLFKKYNVDRIPVNDKFDPTLHEAVSTEEGGEKLEEVRAGYTMHGRVVRPARVKIVK